MDQERVWVQQARRGDQAAFARLVAAYQGPVFNLAYRMLGNPGDAEDAAQETFLRAYDRLGSYEPERKFSSWILAIASHYCIDQLRRRRINFESLDDLPTWRSLPSEDAAPEDVALAGEQERMLQRAVGTLAPDYRLPVILRYWHEMSYEEIAETMDSTVSAIKSRLHRARLMLAEAVEAGGRADTPSARQDAHAAPPEVKYGRGGAALHALRTG